MRVFVVLTLLALLVQILTQSPGSYPVNAQQDTVVTFEWSEGRGGGGCAGDVLDAAEALKEALTLLQPSIMVTIDGRDCVADCAV